MSIFLFIVILLVLILVHEFGHFIVAKKSGIRVDEFGIGFPPRIKTLWKKGETEYTLNWIPFGGFVKIFGENPDEASLSGPDSARSFVHKSKLIQAAVLVAGVAFNILFAWFLFWVIFVIGTPTALSEEERHIAEDVRLIVSEVFVDTPAAEAGFLPGDELVKLEAVGDMVSNPLPSELIAFIEQHPTELITVSLQRGDEELVIQATPSTNIIEGNPEQPAFGFAMGLVGLVRHNPVIAIWESLEYTVRITGLLAVAIGGFVWEALTLQANFAEVAGPVGIVGIVGDAQALGFVFLLNFTAFISINLAIINLLPFPALDGGRLLFVAIEAIKGSPIKPKVANALNTVGFALLILLMLLVTYSDIIKLSS